MFAHVIFEQVIFVLEEDTPIVIRKYPQLRGEVVSPLAAGIYGSTHGSHRIKYPRGMKHGVE